jgi:hypothetical protein
MDRARIARVAAPVAVFGLVLGTVVLVTRGGSGGTHRPRPIPVAARGFRAGEQATAGAPRDAVAGWAPYGTTTIPDSLLAGLPTTGPVYRTGRADSAGVGALAKAFGVTGEVRTEPGGWTVGTGDRALHASDSPGLPWWLGESKVYAVDAVATANAATSVTAPGSAAPASAPPPKPGATPQPGTVDPAPPCVSPPPNTKADCGPEPGPIPVPLPPPSQPPQPTDAAARAGAAPLLDALGLSGATVSVQPGWAGKDVVASPVLGGLPTVGYDTRLTVDVQLAVISGNGFLGAATLDDTYPLLDPKAALARGAQGGIYADGREPMPLPPVTSLASPAPAPPERVATGVRLGLVQVPSYDNTAGYLVPAWLLTFAESDYPEPVVALPDEYLATPPPVTGEPGKPGDPTAKPDEPVCDPAPCPVDVPPDAGGSGSGSTGSGGSGVASAEPGTAVPPAP